MALQHPRPPYVPWSFHFTHDASDRLARHFGCADVEALVDNHFVELGSDIGFFTDLGGHQFRDVFGAVWDRSGENEDIGIIREYQLREPTLRGYSFPDPLDPRFFADIPGKLARHPDRFRMYCLGFSLFERAWTLRGMEPLFMDFYDHPAFVRELLNTIADYNIAQVTKALDYDSDAVYFGDDWGQQHGLLMGYPLWREFIYPVLKRMYGVVRAAGKFVVIHSCGDVDELFDDLVEIGLNCFNPFQPEVMDVESLMLRYRGRLAFWGGLSVQQLIPFGTPEQIGHQTRRLIELGSPGGYVLAPSHNVVKGVPVENMIAFIDAARTQPGTGLAALEAV